MISFKNGCLYKGDCITNLKTLDEKSIDVCITSPPYNAKKDYEKERLSNEAFLKFNKDWIEQVFRILKDGGKFFLNIGWWAGRRKKRLFLPMRFIEIAEEAGFKLTSWINWVKGTLKAPQCSAGVGDIYGVSPFFGNGDEPILYFVKGKRKHEDNKHDNWIKWVKCPWVFPTSKDRKHPAPFPYELPFRCIKMTSIEGWTILDPFGGGGTTALAAIDLNRKFILMEKEEKYCELIEQRIRDREIKLSQ